MKNFGEKGAWAYPGTAQFFGTANYLRNGYSYELQICPERSQGTFEQKPGRPKSLGEKGAWAHPGTAKNLRLLPIISGTGKATNFKLCSVRIFMARIGRKAH